VDESWFFEGAPSGVRPELEVEKGGFKERLFSTPIPEGIKTGSGLVFLFFLKEREGSE